jgi:hypothetical protein
LALGLIVLRLCDADEWVSRPTLPATALFQDHLGTLITDFACTTPSSECSKVARGLAKLANLHEKSQISFIDSDAIAWSSNLSSIILSPDAEIAPGNQLAVRVPVGKSTHHLFPVEVTTGLFTLGLCAWVVVTSVWMWAKTSKRAKLD